MKKLAIDEGASQSFEPTSIHTLMKKGLSEKETIKLLQPIFSYPHVGQTFFALVCPDGIEWHHFNNNQLPFDVLTDPYTDLSYDYYVATYFQKSNRQHTHKKILALTKT